MYITERNEEKSLNIYNVSEGPGDFQYIIRHKIPQ